MRHGEKSRKLNLRAKEMTDYFKGFSKKSDSKTSSRAKTQYQSFSPRFRPMLKKVKATYRNGTFIPNTPCYLPDNTEVELMIDVTSEYAHNIVDRETRKEILNALLSRMRESSLMGHVNRATLSE